MRFLRDGSRLLVALVMATATVGTGMARLASLVETGRLKHTERMLALTWTADGKAIITGSRDGSVQIWDVAKKQVIATFGDGTSPVRAVAIHPDRSSSFLSGGVDTTIRRWLKSGSDTDAAFQAKGAVRGLAGSPDRSKVAVSSADVVQIWDLSSGASPPSLTGLPPSGINVGPVAWSGDGTSSPTDGPIATADDLGSIYVWQNSTAAKPMQFQLPRQRRVTGLGFSPDGKALLSSDRSGSIERWSIPINDIVPAGGTALTQFSAASDGSAIATGGPGTPNFIAIRAFGGAPVTINLLASETLTELALSQDGTAVLCALSAPPLRYYKASAPMVFRTITDMGGAFNPTALAFRLKSEASKDSVIAAASIGKDVKIYSADILSAIGSGSGPTVMPVTITPGTDDVTALAFGPDNEPGGPFLYVAAGTTLTKWNLASTTMPAVTFRAHARVINCCAITPDGATVITGSADETIIISQSDGTFKIGGDVAGAVKSASFSRDGKALAITTEKGSTKLVRYWDVTDPAAPRSLQDLSLDTSPMPLGALPSGKPSPATTVLTAWPDDVRIWTPAAQGFLDPQSTTDLGAATGVAFDAQGKQALASFRNNAIVRFDLAGRARPMVFDDHDGAVIGASFASDTILVSATRTTLFVRDIAAALGTTPMPVPPPTKLTITTASGASATSLAVTPAPTSATPAIILVGFSDNTAQVFTLNAGTLSIASTLGPATVNTANRATNAVAILGEDPGFKNARFVLGSEDTNVTLWPLSLSPGAVAKPIATYNGEPGVFGLAWIPISGRISTQFTAASGDNVLRIWNVGSATPAVRTTVNQPGEAAERVFAVAAKADGIAIGTGKPAVRIFDEKGVFKKEAAGTSLPTLAVRAVAYDATGVKVAFGSDDQVVRLCDATGNNAKLLGIHTAPIVAVSFCRQTGKSNFLASVDSGGTVIVWDTSVIPPKVFQDTTLKDASEVPLAMDWSPDGATATLAIAIASNQVVLYQVTFP
jgi:WD40 repeat protein